MQRECEKENDVGRIQWKELSAGSERYVSRYQHNTESLGLGHLRQSPLFLSICLALFTLCGVLSKGRISARVLFVEALGVQLLSH